MILVIDNFISQQEIDYCLNIIKNTKTFDKNFCRRYIISIDKSLHDDDIIKLILQKLLNQASRISNEKLKIDTAELVVFPEFAFHEFHLDKDLDKLTSVLYLNDNFRGGETIFEDGTSVSPVPGRVVFFDAKKYIHGVNMITKGNRCTLPIWYR
jgi:hypothetical protein